MAKVFVLPEIGKHFELDSNDIISLGDIYNKLPEINKYISERILTGMDVINNSIEGIKFGDVVQIFEEVIENDGKLLWDGEKLVELDHDINDYGSLPSNFTLNKVGFNFQHWRFVFDNIAWVDLERFILRKIDNLSDFESGESYLLEKET